MFWKTEIVETTSLTELLEKDGVTLEEVLEDEFLIQELKIQNEKLVGFLTEPDSISKLLRYSTTDPGGETTDTHRFRFAHRSSEVLTSNVDEICSAMTSTEETRSILTSFLSVEKPETLNPLLASFYTKIMTQLLAKDTKDSQVLKLLQSSSSYVDDLIKNMGTSSVMDLCYRLYTVPDTEEETNAIKQWLCDSRFPQKLVDLFDVKVDRDAQMNAANLWSETVKILRDFQYTKLEKTPDILLDAFQGKECLSGLLCKMFEQAPSTSSHSVIVNGCQVFTALLQTVYIQNNPRELAELANSANPPWRGGAPQGHPDYGKPGFTQQDEDRGSDMWTPDPDHVVENCLAEKMGDFHRYLEGTGKEEVKLIFLSMGKIDKPVGAGRLAVVKLLACLLNTNHEKTMLEMSRLGTMKLILDLMFMYPWNNFLHTAINQCILCVLFSGKTLNPVSTNQNESTDTESANQEQGSSAYSFGSKSLIRSLLLDSRLLEKIMETEENTKITDNKVSNSRQYTGHVMQLAEVFENARLRGPNKALINATLTEMVDDFKEKWEWFVESSVVAYQKLNEPDCVDIGPDLDTSLETQRFENLEGNRFEITSDGLEFGDSEEDGGNQDLVKKKAKQLFVDYQTQGMQSGMTEKFGMPMDTFTAIEKDEIMEVLSKQSKSIKVEEIDDVLPPGEQMFEAMCDSKINTEWGNDPFADKSGSHRKNSSSSEEEEDPWATTATADKEKTDNWADFGSFEKASGDQGSADVPAAADTGWTADFGSVFGNTGGVSGRRSTSPSGQDDSWGFVSPVSQGIAVSTASVFDWGRERGSPKRERSRSGDKSKIVLEPPVLPVSNGPATF